MKLDPKHRVSLEQKIAGQLRTVAAAPPSQREERLEDHWLIEPTKDRIVWCRRQNRPYQSPEQAEIILSMFNSRIERYPRSLWTILLDARGGPVPNPNPAIEQMIMKREHARISGFPANKITDITGGISPDTANA